MNLITEQDKFELVRDKIIAVLIAERDDQMQQAQAQSLDPQLWNFKAYIERSMPWGQYLEPKNPLTPIVNVWYDSDSTDPAATTRAETQKFNGFYNIDIFAASKGKTTINGQVPADEAAAIAAQRIGRIVRNILMASEYTYLGLPRGTAWDREIQSRQMFQPDIGDTAAVKISAMRIRFRVSFNETAPQYEGVPLDSVRIELLRKEDGEVYTTLLYE